MHQPRPYGRFVGQTELSEADAAAVEALARSLTNFKSVSNLDSMKKVRELPSGRQAVAVDMGGTFRIMVYERHEDPEYRFEGLAETNLPMLYCGVITKAIVRKDDGEGVRIKLTEQTRRRLSGYGEASLPPKEVELQRFVIEYRRDFAYFKPKITGIMTHTQYVRQRPTWYSGAMAQVMQVAGGYGRQRLEELPEDELERARLLVPEKYMQRIRKDLVNVRLPGYTGFPDEEGQFRCDYKFRKCHGVSFDSTGKPWLLQIDRSGVHAMPLPIVPSTATPAFREYVEDVGDEELLTLLDRFGGLPTGEGFPDPGEDFEAWRRAGVIIKVCETEDFYDKQSFYDASGWSFNSKGTEGFNTCWEYGANGLIQSYAYKLRLRMGAAEEHGWIPLNWTFASQDEADRLNAYLSGIYSQLSANKPRDLAIKYKIRRHSVQELLGLTDRGIDYWDGLEMDPIATHEGSLNQTASGPIYWGGVNLASMGRLKFPTLTGEGCESFIMVSPDYHGPKVRCDTIVFGCYVDDQLQVVKYFLDDREFKREERSTFESPMIVGRWERTVTFGSSGLMGYFYTTDFDDRQEAPERETHTEIIGEDLGYGNPAYHTPPIIMSVGSVSRSRYYSHVTKTRTTEGFSLDVAICVPVFARDCILYPYKDRTTGRSESESGERKGMADSTSYQLWTYDFIFHWFGSTLNGNKGEPRPTEGEYVYVDTMISNPEADPTGFATSGDWLGLGGGVIDVSGMLAPYTSRASGTHHGNGVVVGGEAPPYQEYSWSKQYPGEDSGRISISFTVAGSKEFSKEKPSQWYYDFSPVESGGSLSYFYRDAIYNAIGKAEYASISEEDRYGRRIKWGNTNLADHKSAHHFIGVINE